MGNTQGNKATGTWVERALRKCDREDIINKCLFYVGLVTDESEEHVAEEALDMIKEAEPIPDKEENVEIIPEREYKQVQEELITEKMEKMTFESGADTSLVEAAVIASRELEVEETGNGNDLTGSAPAPSAAAPSSGGQLEPALIHSDDDPSKEDDDKDDEILPTKDDIPRRKQHDADSDSSEE